MLAENGAERIRVVWHRFEGGDETKDNACSKKIGRLDADAGYEGLEW